MLLTPDDLSYLCQRAISAAQHAGRLIESYATNTVLAIPKRGGSHRASQVVTEVDLLSEAAILAMLEPDCKRYDLGLLTEERIDDNTRLQKDYFWCIDPLDGTLPFIESCPGYAVSIALVAQSGEPLIGVVYDPLAHTLYAAVQGQGAFRNGRPWQYSQASVHGKPLTLACDRGLVQQHDYPAIHQELEVMAIKCGFTGLHTLLNGGAVMNACWGFENPPGCYFKLPKSEDGGGSLWDFAATAAIAAELGAVASDVYGHSLDLNRTGSTFMNHRGAIFATDLVLATDILGVLRRYATGQMG